MPEPEEGLVVLLPWEDVVLWGCGVVLGVQEAPFNISEPAPRLLQGGPTPYFQPLCAPGDYWGVGITAWHPLAVRLPDSAEWCSWDFVPTGFAGPYKEGTGPWLKSRAVQSGGW